MSKFLVCTHVFSHFNTHFYTWTHTTTHVMTTVTNSRFYIAFQGHCVGCHQWHDELHSRWDMRCRKRSAPWWLSPHLWHILNHQSELTALWYGGQGIKNFHGGHWWGYDDVKRDHWPHVVRGLIARISGTTRMLHVGFSSGSLVNINHPSSRKPGNLLRGMI